MPSLKTIRKRISSVKSTQKITRAMKMVAGARLNRAQQRIVELRPYATKTQKVLAAITQRAEGQEAGGEAEHRLLVNREEKRVLLVVLTSDRGLCAAFNTNINKRAEREWREREAQGQEVKLLLIGRKGRDYFTRRGAPIYKYLPGVWEALSLAKAEEVGAELLQPFERDEVDSIYLIYNEFKSAMSQLVTVESLLPVPQAPAEAASEEALSPSSYQFEPGKAALLDVLVPMYLDISVLRALYESMASELGARMTAMDSATKNASEMISSLTLQFNKARQAAITKELMEIVSGSEALRD